jgi:4-aminobutyrate aminotransferase
VRGSEGVDEVLEVRGKGLLIGIELAAAGSAVAVAERALRAGLIVLPAGERGETLELAPPAVLTEAQADHAVDAVVERIRLWSEER